MGRGVAQAIDLSSFRDESFSMYVSSAGGTPPAQ
jgi:hypothetical protein